MITNWRYHDGEPTYMPTIDSWTERLRPAWHCCVYGTSLGKEVQAWIDHNLQGDHHTTLRFNSGDPYLAVSIHTETDAMAFQLRWL